MALVNPSGNAQEMRSFRYFMDVTAPSIAGSFDVKFWLEEIPQACQADPAVWHAIVSLGSVYEHHATWALTGHEPLKNDFALQQFNTSIRLLAALPSSPANKWRTLVVSVIFTCICVLESLWDEARVHFRYGYTLLLELQTEPGSRVENLPIGDLNLEAGEEIYGSTEGESTDGLVQRNTDFESPVSLDSLKCILSAFELREYAIFNSVLRMPTILSDKDLYRAWQHYTVPSEPSGENLTTENLFHANRAAQSLTNSLVVFSQDNAKELATLYQAATHEGATQDLLNFMLAKRTPLLVCFSKIAKAIEIFREELGPESQAETWGPRKAHDRAQLRLAFLTLCLYHEINRLTMDWQETEFQQGTIAISSVSCAHVLDLAEEAESLHSILRTWGGGKPTPPAAPIIFPALMVVFMGKSWDERRRALRIVQRPRLEGFLENAMSVSLSTAIMDRELEIEMEMAAELAQASGEAMPTEDELLQARVNPIYKVTQTSFEFTGRRRARLELRTLYEVTSELPGKTVDVEW
jgi:hypothetical protein